MNLGSVSISKRRIYCSHKPFGQAPDLDRQVLERLGEGDVAITVVVASIAVFGASGKDISRLTLVAVLVGESSGMQNLGNGSSHSACAAPMAGALRGGVEATEALRGVDYSGAFFVLGHCFVVAVRELGGTDACREGVIAGCY